MAKFVIIRADPNSPNRCQSTTQKGQCPNQAYLAPDGTFPGDKCVMHGGQSAAVKYNETLGRQYKLTKYKDRLQEFAINPDVKSLRDEIGIMRIMIEERLNMIKDPFDMIAASGPISEMVAKLERLVRTCQTLEEKTGVTLDRNQVMVLGDTIISIILKNILELDLPEETSSNLMSKIGSELDDAFKPQRPALPQNCKQIEAVEPDDL